MSTLEDPKKLVVRNGSSDVTRVCLSGEWTSGRIVQRRMIVNSQIAKFYKPPPELPFEVLTLPWPR